MSFRAPVLDDAPAVYALLEARDIADLGQPDYTVEDILDDWRRSEFDLSTDALVAEADDGSLIGYAAVLRMGTDVVVAPDYEGRGIGTRLLQWSERRDRELGRERHRQWVAEHNAAGRALLLAAGYRSERSYWRMARRLDDLSAALPPPPGVMLRAPRRDGDAVTLHELSEASFADNPDHRPQSFAVFSEQHLEGHDVDLELSSVAERNGVAIGFLLSRRWQDEGAGLVDLLAVHPDHRGRGLGQAMLQAAFAGFAAADLGEAQLGVAADNPKALRLYERCGMTARFRFDTYTRGAGQAA